jgi:hypothetical protein
LNGGCPITGFQLFRDDAITGVPTEEITTLQEGSEPTLMQLEFPLSMTGYKYTFQLKVSNRDGTTASELIQYLFAAVPDIPSSAPVILEYNS